MIRRSIENIYRLGIKELWSLVRDPMMLVLIAYSFTLAIYSAATAQPETLHKAPIAVVDSDKSTLSQRVLDSFYLPHFVLFELDSERDMDQGMDDGYYTFAVTIPPNFEKDVLAGKRPSVQLNIDATRMSQAFAGSGYIQQIFARAVGEFVREHGAFGASPNVDIEERVRFNPVLNQKWFGSIMEVINQITMIAIILSGAALIREREHGTIEHLLVMPVTPAQIMLSKIWASSLVVMLATFLSVELVVKGGLHVPIQGSLMLFMVCVSLHLVAMTSMGIFMATISRSMPQFGLLLIMTLLPMQMLSGGMTPRESMPDAAQLLMLAAPTTHFTALSQAILYRGAGLSVVWPQMLAIVAIAAVFYFLAMHRFRKMLLQGG